MWGFGLHQPPRYKPLRDLRGVHRFFDRPPIWFTVPQYDRWFVTVDYRGYAPSGRAAVEAFPRGVVQGRQRHPFGWRCFSA